VLLSVTETRRSFLENKASARLGFGPGAMRTFRNRQDTGPTNSRKREPGPKPGTLPVSGGTARREPEGCSRPLATWCVPEHAGGLRWATDGRAPPEGNEAAPEGAPVPAWAGVVALELHGSHESSDAGTRRSLPPSKLGGTAPEPELRCAAVRFPQGRSLLETYSGGRAEAR